MQIPSSFWNFNIGHVGTAALVIASGITAWTSLRNEEIQLRKEHDALVIEVRQMDERGTHASQKGIYQESETSKSSQRRLEELEHEWHEIGPRIERIDARLEQFMISQGIPLKKQ